jgi:hypothetical protein
LASAYGQAFARYQSSNTQVQVYTSDEALRRHDRNQLAGTPRKTTSRNRHGEYRFN